MTEVSQLPVPDCGMTSYPDLTIAARFVLQCSDSILLWENPVSVSDVPAQHNLEYVMF